MKRISGFLIILIAIFAGVFVASKFTAKHTLAPLPKNVQNTRQTQTVESATTQIPVPGIPQTLIIPSINVNANVEPVGLDAQQRMDVPEHNEDVGWYKLGPRPGEKGSAVIDGHLDTVTGAPAAFWDLKKLQIGDTIQSVDDKGKTYTFKVTDVETFPFDQVPLQQIFASTDKARLNLITCGGTWDQTSKNYSNRTVVYSELVQ